MSEENKTQRTVLMSIVTKQATKIMDGTKKYEFRKNIPRISEDEALSVVVYSSQIDKAVVGRFTVSRVLREPLDTLMEATGYANDPEARQWFGKYYGDRAMCNALEVGVVERFDQPIPLDSLRAADPAFRPPQNFIYLPPEGALTQFIESRRTSA
ncbi:MAG TPA: hypothetical protein VFI74_00900 [Candidatus Saccharimonadales bacterium]|nr:hypothetical protein [Candidatus Saccharimonadales bacterium]